MYKLTHLRSTVLGTQWCKDTTQYIRHIDKNTRNMNDTKICGFVRTWRHPLWWDPCDCFTKSLGVQMMHINSLFPLSIYTEGTVRENPIINHHKFESNVWKIIQHICRWFLSISVKGFLRDNSAALEFWALIHSFFQLSKGPATSHVPC